MSETTLSDDELNGLIMTAESVSEGASGRLQFANGQIRQALLELRTNRQELVRSRQANRTWRSTSDDARSLLAEALKSLGCGDEHGPESIGDLVSDAECVRQLAKKQAALPFVRTTAHSSSCFCVCHICIGKNADHAQCKYACGLKTRDAVPGGRV